MKRINGPKKKCEFLKTRRKIKKINVHFLGLKLIVTCGSTIIWLSLNGFENIWRVFAPSIF